MSESNGKLSSRVMNMKFMRHTGSAAKQPQEEEKPAQDESKWNSSTKCPRKKVMVRKPKRLVKSNIGITVLKGVALGRKCFQNDETKKEKEKEKENGEEKDDDYDLDKIFKQVKQKGGKR